MPPYKGLEMFVRRKQLTDEEWFSLIENRRELIKPHLDSFTLAELGSLKCLRSAHFSHELRLDAPALTGDKQFSLKTEGIFNAQTWSAVEKIPNSGYQPPPGGVNVRDGTMQVWGLTRSGFWILVAINFVGESGYKERGYERAKTVNITEADLPTIVAKTKEKPQQIWEDLGKTIKSWAEHRESLYNQALGFARMIEIEERIFSLIPK